MSQVSFRLYGSAPYSLVLVHGGPGARGSLAGAAKEIGKTRGVLEALQTGTSIESLLQELHEQLHQTACPVTLAGHSWGAWLSILYAARFPNEVRHLVLVSCPPLTPEFVPQILQNRLALLSNEEALAFQTALFVVEKQEESALKEQAFQTLEFLTQKTDFFEPCPYDDQALDMDVSQYQLIWPQAIRLRKENKFVQAAAKLVCPITILHGKQDPHPLQGVTKPLRTANAAFQLIVFDKCSHSPFAEKYARDDFYQFLQQA